MKWVGHVARMRRTAKHPGFQWGNRKEKRTLGRPKNRWEDNVTDMKEKEWKYVQGINLAKDRDEQLALVNTVMKLRVA